MALSNRGVKVNSLKGTAASFSAEDIGSLPKIKAVDIKVEIDIDDKDSDILEAVRKIFEKGCLITCSISPAIQVTHSISRICLTNASIAVKRYHNCMFFIQSPLSARP
jgi:uncharacterized OsmC-like protein